MSRNGNGSHPVAEAAAPKPLAAAPRWVIEVAARHGSTDAAGLAILSQLPALGISGVREARVSTLYEISGRYNVAQLGTICRELLADPITQEHRMDSATPSPAFLIGPHWRIEVWLKPQVADPVGESVTKAIADLGLPAPESARTGAAYILLGRLAAPQAERLARKLFANPLIHRTCITQR